MYEALQKLKKDVSDKNTLHFGGTSCTKLYEIKQLAITQYKPYIEAIICANSDAAEKSTHFGDMQFANKKYSLEYIDLDIVTKFISTKDLSALVKTYDVKKLNIGTLADCFKNLCHSVVGAKTYGVGRSSFSALSNIILLLNLVDLDADNKKKIVSSIEELLRDETISPFFFSIGWPDFRECLRELSKLCGSLTFSKNFELVHQIVSNERFFDYAANVHFNSLR